MSGYKGLGHVNHVVHVSAEISLGRFLEVDHSRRRHRPDCGLRGALDSYLVLNRVWLRCLICLRARGLSKCKGRRQSDPKNAYQPSHLTLHSDRTLLDQFDIPRLPVQQYLGASRKLDFWYVCAATFGARVKGDNVRFWHLADINAASENVRFRG
jgi:hypothetical protein